MHKIIFLFCFITFVSCKEKLDFIHDNPFDEKYTGEAFIFMDSIQQFTNYTLNGQGDTTFTIDLKGFAHTTYDANEVFCAFYWNGSRRYPKDGTFIEGKAIQYFYNLQKGDVITVEAALSNNIDRYSSKSNLISYTVK